MKLTLPLCGFSTRRRIGRPGSFAISRPSFNFAFDSRDLISVWLVGHSVLELTKGKMKMKDKAYVDGSA